MIDFTKINDILNKLSNVLRSESQISDSMFYSLVSKYGKSLNSLLKIYAISPPDIKTKNKPYLLYYKQIYHYLTYILRFPDILLIPSHSEIQQTLNFINNQEKLLKEVYFGLALKESALFKGEFIKNLEKNLKTKEMDN